MTPYLRPPAGLRRRLRLLARTVVTLGRVELNARRVPLPQLCERFGVELAGFTPPVQPTELLPFDLAARWWAVETTLKWWPFARQRPCLRRSLVLGHDLRAFAPHLCLTIVSAEPFLAHAWLVVRGQHLDMGPATGQMTRSVSEAA
ncbi:lasso peptide biosynthesis B2 protein [uncultured Jatrophihabitans sp.]|uniref:lasso peptide biosynthesis B2 protein n=1 Tax=uncultured Jatrophihabitans sp. TaxID=1610747 RepID=UPI0035C9986C